MRIRVNAREGMSACARVFLVMQASGDVESATVLVLASILDDCWGKAWKCRPKGQKVVLGGRKLKGNRIKQKKHGSLMKPCLATGTVRKKQKQIRPNPPRPRSDRQSDVTASSGGVKPEMRSWKGSFSHDTWPWVKKRTHQDLRSTSPWFHLTHLLRRSMFSATRSAAPGRRRGRSCGTLGNSWLWVKKNVQQWQLAKWRN